MSKKPVIVIPATPLPTSGIVHAKGIAYVWYYQDGKRRRHSIGPSVRGESWISKDRDTFYKDLLAAGATVATRGPKTLDRKAKAAADPNRYIQQRKPFVVVIGGKVIAECDTEEGARKARDKHLKIR
jgi:hypothetical protein